MTRGAHAIDVPDHLSRPGAEMLAARLAAYWLERGRVVQTRIESANATIGGATTHLFCVRSDLTWPLPQRGKLHDELPPLRRLKAYPARVPG